MNKQSSSPTALEATPPVLSLFRAGPLAVLRIHDLAFSDVVSAVVKALPSDVASLMLVTPTDTKMFNLSNGKASYASTHTAGVSGSTHETSSSDSRDGVIAEADDEASDPQAAASALARQDPSEAGAVDPPDETPAARRKRMKAITAEAPASDPCRRCNGSGQIAIALESGGSTSAACGVCKGAGVIKRFGERRR